MDAYQYNLEYCSTWAPFLTGQLVRVAVLDDVDLHTASIGLDQVIEKILERLRRSTRATKAIELIDSLGRLLTAASAAQYLRVFKPGGSDPKDIMQEIAPDIITRSPLMAAFSFMADENQEAYFYGLEWYFIMHARPRCAQWMFSKKREAFRVVPGFRNICAREASKLTWATIQQQLQPDKAWANRLTHKLLWLQGSDGLFTHDMDPTLPKTMIHEARGSYHPSAVAQEVAELFGISDDSASHYDAFGKGAEIAIRRSKMFYFMDIDIVAHVNAKKLRGLAIDLRFANGGFGHRWLEGMLTPRLREEWMMHPKLPDFKNFLEASNCRIVPLLDKYRAQIREVLDKVLGPRYVRDELSAGLGEAVGDDAEKSGGGGGSGRTEPASGAGADS